MWTKNGVSSAVRAVVSSNGARIQQPFTKRFTGRGRKFNETRTKSTREHPVHCLRQWHLGVSESMNLVFFNALANGVVTLHVRLLFLESGAFLCQYAVFGAVAVCVANNWRVQVVRGVVTFLVVRVVHHVYGFFLRSAALVTCASSALFAALAAP